MALYDRNYSKRCSAWNEYARETTDHRGKIFFFVCVRFRLMGVAVGIASRCCELLGKDDSQADRLDLSLDERCTIFTLVDRCYEYVTYDRVVGVVVDGSALMVKTRYFSSSPFKISSTSLARNKVRLVGNDDSEQPWQRRRRSREWCPIDGHEQQSCWHYEPNSINHFRSSDVIERRHKDGYFL